VALGGRTVTAPNGTEWHVARQWWPWRPRRRDIDSPDIGGFDLADGADDVLGVIVLVFAALVLVVVFFTVIVPVIALGLELIALLIVFFWGIGTRVILRRPWTIRARARDGRVIEWKAKGFLRSGRVRDEAAAALARGEAQPRPPEALPA
jgi:hypothetical protein